MAFLLELGTRTMEARAVEALPAGDGWQFEPKWDGFRCLLFKAGETVELRAKSGKSLSRYFPEMVAALSQASVEDCVLDGELTIPHGTTLSFGALQDRVHPAESRIRTLSVETPGLLILFDCLASASAGRLLEAPLTARRAELERLCGGLGEEARTRLSPFTLDRERAALWLDTTRAALDGVIAKRADGAYEQGVRAMMKLKRIRSADCVVGGFRFAQGTELVGSLLLGLFNVEGRLDHVGFTSAISHAERPELTARLEVLRGGVGFSGDAPGGPSRWGERSAAWVPLRPELVVEVGYDQVTDGRFRHGTKLLRWRPDKAAAQCTMEQLREEVRPGRLVEMLVGDTAR